MNVPYWILNPLFPILPHQPIKKHNYNFTFLLSFPITLISTHRRFSATPISILFFFSFFICTQQQSYKTCMFKLANTCQIIQAIKKCSTQTYIFVIYAYKNLREIPRNKSERSKLNRIIWGTVRSRCNLCRVWIVALVSQRLKLFLSLCILCAWLH